MKGLLVLFVLSALLCSLVRANEDETVPLTFIEPKDGSIQYHSHPLRIHLHAANSLKVPVQVSITCPDQPILSQVLRTEQVAVIALPPELRGDVCEVSVSQVAYPLSAPEPVFVAIIDEDWAMELMQEPSIEDTANSLIEEDHLKVRFVEEPVVQVSEPITIVQVNEPEAIQKTQMPQQSPYLQPRPQTHLNNPVQMQQLTQQLNQLGQVSFGQPVQQKQVQHVQQQQRPARQQQIQQQHTPILHQRPMQQQPMQQQMPRLQPRPMPSPPPPQQQQQYHQQPPIQQRQQYQQYNHQPHQYQPQQQSNSPPIFQYHHQNQFGGGFAPSFDTLTPINPWTDPAADPNTDPALDALIADMERKSRGGDRPQWQGISRNEFARMDDESYGSSSSIIGIGGKFRIERPAMAEEEYTRQEQFRKSRRSRRSIPAQGRKSDRKSVNFSRKSEKKSINSLLDTLSHQPSTNPFSRRSRKSTSKPVTVNSVISVNKSAKSVTKQKKEKKGGRNAARKSQRRRQ